MSHDQPPEVRFRRWCFAMDARQAWLGMRGWLAVPLALGYALINLPGAIDVPVLTVSAFIVAFAVTAGIDVRVERWFADVHVEVPKERLLSGLGWLLLLAVVLVGAAAAGGAWAVLGVLAGVGLLLNVHQWVTRGGLAPVHLGLIAAIVVAATSYALMPADVPDDSFVAAVFPAVALIAAAYAWHTYVVMLPSVREQAPQRDSLPVP